MAFEPGLVEELVEFWNQRLVLDFFLLGELQQVDRRLEHSRGCAHELGIFVEFIFELRHHVLDGPHSWRGDQLAERSFTQLAEVGVGSQHVEHPKPHVFAESRPVPGVLVVVLEVGQMYPARVWAFLELVIE